MTKPNYAFAKRQRDSAKKQKKEEKRQRKALHSDETASASTADVNDAATLPVATH